MSITEIEVEECPSHRPSRCLTAASHEVGQLQKFKSQSSESQMSELLHGSRVQTVKDADPQYRRTSKSHPTDCHRPTQVQT